MNHKSLFSPIVLGDLTLNNRVFMSPMARTRVAHNDVIMPIAATYYIQRTGAGLMISEAIYITPGGKVRTSQPGVFTAEQIAAWKKVTDAVHDKDGVLFAQLSHSGRSAIPEYNGSLPPVAPSALPFNSGPHGSISGKPLEPVIPKALTLPEIKSLIRAYHQVAKNAKSAGFDEVELHAGNAGLVEQFLHTVSNDRNDEYGGPLESRSKFLVEVIDQLIAVDGSERVGLRLSPHDRLSDQHDPDPIATTAYVADEMNRRGIAYINVLEPGNKFDDYIPYPQGDPDTLATIRAHFKGL
jgi:N-ethylmaleimide reductase